MCPQKNDIPRARKSWQGQKNRKIEKIRSGAIFLDFQLPDWAGPEIPGGQKKSTSGAKKSVFSEIRISGSGKSIFSGGLKKCPPESKFRTSN